MPANKYALLRYRIIDRCLKNTAKMYPSREDLRAACEEALYGSGGDAISLSTIDKDIWAMKNEGELGYYAPITYNRQHGGYHYTDPDYSISDMSLGDDDLQALRFAVATLDQFRHVPLFKQYESAIEKIISRVNISPNPEDDDLEKYIQFEKSTVSGGIEFLGPLLDAIKNRIIVRFNYRKFQDNVEKSYKVHPYLLKEYNNRWYLIAWNVERQSVATFGLERILSLEVESEKFKINTNFDADLFFKHSIGITETQHEPVRIVLIFSGYTGRFLITQPIHASQKVLSQDDQRVEIELYVLPTEELYNFILGFGPRVRVESPESVVTEVKSRLQETVHLYA
jgi:predicted DNA-binding transcriptional regulator YafY